MQLKKIQEYDLRSKRILLRVDFNVSVENGKIKEKFKIESCKETLDYLIGMNCKIAMLSWLGRPGGKKDPKFSLEQISDDVEKLLGYEIKFVSECEGEKVKNIVNNLGNKEVALLENVRFYSGEGDVESGTEYNQSFAQKIAANFDVFVNDAISVSHRNQASVVGVAKFIPSYAGFKLQKEVEEFEKIRNNSQHPAVAIIGGAKIETKLPVIKFFEQIYDYVLVGGKIANEAADRKIDFGRKVILPEDYSGERLDIGPKTIEKFSEVIKNAKTIVWNGPLGKFEDKEYAKGTQAVFEAIISSGAYTVVGGGETLEILEKNSAMNKVNFVSTGGGAMLEYIGGGQMPGIEVLKLKI